MTHVSPTLESLASALAAELRDAREEIVRRWLERIIARVNIDIGRVFPTAELLNHVPLLIDGIATMLEHPDRNIDDEVPVVAKAMELGALRHSQGFDAHQILKEQELLGAILLNYVSEVIEPLAAGCHSRDVVECCIRLTHALEMIGQATTNHFLRLSADRVNEREERLRRFNRMVSHELKNRVGAIRGAAGLLHEDWLDERQRARFQGMVRDNADELERVLRNLEALSRVQSDSRQQRNVLLPQAAAEAVRQLRDQAQARGVDVRISASLPTVEVDAATVELCLMNYVSNAVKYSDSTKPEKWVVIDGELRFDEGSEPGGVLVVAVRDNGIGVPPEARERLFEQFFRAHSDTITGVEGTGLGLSIVRETVEAIGGTAWADFSPDSTVFGFTLPSRRQEDAAAAGTARG